MQKPHFRLPCGLFFLLLALSPEKMFSQGEENQTGVSGVYNGNSTTGSNYDPFTQNAMRIVDDIVVPGSVGAYPLKWTRYCNSRNISGSAGGWTFSYDYLIGSDNGAPTMVFPDGRVINTETSAGVPERLDTWTDTDGTRYQAIFLADGGKVVFGPDGPFKIIDPYGQVTTIARTILGYDNNGHPNRYFTKVTEPGGRFLQIDSGPAPIQSNAILVLSVEAYDGTGPGGKGNLLDSVTYTYGDFIGQSGGGPGPILIGATYQDGTSATYTYARNSFYPPPVGR